MKSKSQQIVNFHNKIGILLILTCITSFSTIPLEEFEVRKSEKEFYQLATVSLLAKDHEALPVGGGHVCLQSHKLLYIYIYPNG